MNNDDRAVAAFRAAYKVTAPGTHYRHRGRDYRVRQVAVTIAEMNTIDGGWTVLPRHLTEQLNKLVECVEILATEKSN